MKGEAIHVCYVMHDENGIVIDSSWVTVNRVIKKRKDGEYAFFQTRYRRVIRDLGFTYVIVPRKRVSMMNGMQFMDMLAKRLDIVPQQSTVQKEDA